MLCRWTIRNECSWKWLSKHKWQNCQLARSQREKCARGKILKKILQSEISNEGLRNAGIFYKKTYVEWKFLRKSKQNQIVFDKKFVFNNIMLICAW